MAGCGDGLPAMVDSNHRVLEQQAYEAQSFKGTLGTRSPQSTELSFFKFHVFTPY